MVKIHFHQEDNMMEKEKKIEVARYIISRFDQYYANVNAKGNFYLTLNSFIIGFIITGYSFLRDKIIFNAAITWLLIGAALIAFIAICAILFAVHPFLKSGNSKKYSSLIFFGSISQMKENEFADDFNQATVDTLLADFSSQIYQLAEGLNKKFSIMTTVGKLMLLQFSLITIIIISLIINNI
jgi:hypothetical protein